MLCQNTTKAARSKITKKPLRNTKANVPVGTLIPSHCAYFIFFYAHSSLLHEYFSRLALVH